MCSSRQHLPCRLVFSWQLGRLHQIRGKHCETYQDKVVINLCQASCSTYSPWLVQRLPRCYWRSHYLFVKAVVTIAGTCTFRSRWWRSRTNEWRGWRARSIQVKLGAYGQRYAIIRVSVASTRNDIEYSRLFLDHWWLWVRARALNVTNICHGNTGLQLWDI